MKTIAVRARAFTLAATAVAMLALPAAVQLRSELGKRR